MTTTAFKKELWETALIESFKGISVADLITKKPTSVEGKTAHFGTASLTTGLQDYTGSVTWEDVNTDTIDLTYDQKKYFAFAVDDVDEVQYAADVMSATAREQTYQIKKAIDSYLFTTMATGAPAANTIGSASTKKAISTSDGAYDYIVDLGTKLDNKDVPNINRYVIAPPEFVNLLAKDKRVIDNANVLSNGIVVGMNVNGMQVIKTANCPANQVLAVYSQATGYGKQIDEIEAMRLQTAFKDGIRGLVVYGAKVLQADGLALLHYSIS